MNILGSFKRAVCLVLALMTLLAVSGCGNNDKETRKITDKELKQVKQQVEDFFDKNDNLMDKCETDYVKSFFSSVDENVGWINLNAYADGDENMTPMEMLEEIVHVNFPFTVDDVKAENCVWNESEECFEVCVPVNVIDFNRVSGKLLADGALGFSGEKLKLEQMEGYTFEEGSHLKDYMTESEKDKPKAVCAFLIDYLLRLGSDEGTKEDVTVKTGIYLKAKEKKGKWIVEIDTDDVLEQMTEKFGIE